MKKALIMAAGDESKSDAVGEIDTSAPFRSVKAALSMFGESAFSPYKSPTVSKSKSINYKDIEGDLERETQLHSARKELSKWAEVEKSCETTRTTTLLELEKAKVAVQVLTGKLQTINESKEESETSGAMLIPTIHPETQSTTDDDDSWKHQLENAREQHAVAVAEVDSIKQELRGIRQQLLGSVDAKEAALRREDDARKASYVNSDRSDQLGKEIAAVEESIAHVKSTDFHAKVEETSLVSEHDAVMKSHRLAVEEVESDIKGLMEEFDPEITVAGLQKKVEEIEAEIEHVQMEMEKARVSDLDDARVVLERVEEEERYLMCLMDSLKNEVEGWKIEHLELKERRDQTESFSGKLEFDLQESKAVLEKASVCEAKTREEYDELVSNLQKLSSESDSARKVVGELKQAATQARMESERGRESVDEVGRKVEEASRNAKEAKVAEAEALNQIKILNEASSHQNIQSSAAGSASTESTSTHGVGAMITITAEKYESLRRTVAELETSADKKVAEAVGQLEAIVESENKAIQLLEVSSQETEQLKLETNEILKMAEITEEAMRAAEEEGRKEKEKMVVEEEESLAVVALAANQPPELPQQKRAVPRKWAQKTPHIRRALMPNLGGIFHRKKSIAGSKSPSPSPSPSPSSP